MNFPELSERTRMFLRLGLFLGVVLLVGFMLFRLFFGGTPSILPPKNDTNPSAENGSLPQGADGRPSSPSQSSNTSPLTNLPSAIANGGETATTQLTTGPITSPHITPHGDVAYYDPADGRFYTIDNEGNATPLSLTTFPSAQNIVFNNTADSAVIEFPDGSNIVYDFSTAKQVTLPSHWESFSFSENDERIAAKSVGTDPRNRALVITHADGSSTEVVAALGNNDDKVSVSWSPASDILGFSETGESTSTFGQRKMYTIGTDGEAAGIITINGTNYKNTWSPNGKFILYSVADSGDDYRPSLWYVDARGDRNGTTRMRLPVKTTVDRCVFYSESTLYCGVPDTAPSGSGTQPEILEGPDSLYKISLPQGTVERIAIPAKKTSLQNLSINDDGSSLYYTDLEGTLNVIRLK